MGRIIALVAVAVAAFVGLVSATPVSIPQTVVTSLLSASPVSEDVLVSLARGKRDLEYEQTANRRVRSAAEDAVKHTLALVDRTEDLATDATSPIKSVSQPIHLSAVSRPRRDVLAKEVVLTSVLTSRGKRGLSDKSQLVSILGRKKRNVEKDADDKQTGPKTPGVALKDVDEAEPTVSQKEVHAALLFLGRRK